MAKCVRCGREATTYGADGLPYCDSCSFYGLNKQCWKCRMYLPISELQQYKGQWVCQYCLMDMREEDQKTAAGGHKEHKKGDLKGELLSKPETCERCGRTLSTVYIVNGKKLCSVCAEEEKKKWEFWEKKPPTMKFRIEKSKGATLFDKIFEFIELLIFRLFGWRFPWRRIKKKEGAEIVPLSKEEIEKDKEKNDIFDKKKLESEGRME